MTQSFYEYFNENFDDGLSNPSKYILQHTYEAGAASRQDEIDELQEKVNREREEATEYFTDLEYSNAKCKELQKRIDEALEFSENIHDENAIDKLYTIIEILKGATP